MTTSPLSPEAVAQMVATLRTSNHLVMRPVSNEAAWDAADMLTTIAADNATLRGYNSELCENYNSQLMKLAHQDDELATLRASEAAALERAEKAEKATDRAHKRAERAARMLIEAVDLSEVSDAELTVALARIATLTEALTEIDNAPSPDHWVPEYQHIKDIVAITITDSQPPVDATLAPPLPE